MKERKYPDEQAEPSPGTGRRLPEAERIADPGQLTDEEVEVIVYAAEQPYAISTLDLVADGFAEDTGEAGNLIFPLWQQTDFFKDRVETRMPRPQDDGRQPRQVYPVKPMTKALVATGEIGTD